MQYILKIYNDFFSKNVNPNTNLPQDEMISHKKCTINAV